MRELSPLGYRMHRSAILYALRYFRGNKARYEVHEPGSYEGRIKHTRERLVKLRERYYNLSKVVAP